LELTGNETPTPGGPTVDEQVQAELHELRVALAGMEIAAWAAMKAVFETNASAAMMFEATSGSLLKSMSGAGAAEVRARAEFHIGRWMPSA
jgi:hypothetical protein